MCKDCIKMHELTHDKENFITIARCNVLTCKEYFIIPMYGAYEKQNENKKVCQFLKMCKRLISLKNSQYL